MLLPVRFQGSVRFADALEWGSAPFWSWLCLLTRLFTSTAGGSWFRGGRSVRPVSATSRLATVSGSDRRACARRAARMPN